MIEAVGLTAGYGDLAAVRDATVDVRPGEIVALFGPNGAGKTTILRTMAGVLPPLAGEVRWGGRALAAPLFKRARMGLAYVPEEKSVITNLSVRENLQLGRGGVDAAVALFPELIPLLARKAGLLSGGEQQMLTLARALAMGPKALLIDELSLGLAPLAVARLFEGLRDAASSSNVGVLLVEQQAARALTICDRWYSMRRGQVVGDGLSEDHSVLRGGYLFDEAEPVPPSPTHDSRSPIPSARPTEDSEA